MIFPSTVVRETTAHLEEAVRNLRTTLRKAISDARRLLPDILLLFESEDCDKIDPGDIAKNSVKRFLSDIRAEEVGVDFADLKDVERRYFDNLPPFAGSGDKKHEFPDAIALSSIEGWAKTKGKRVLAVSNDKGWLSYSSESIKVVSTLSEALGILQKDPEHLARLFVAARLRELPLRTLYPYSAAFSELLSKAVEQADFNVEAQSDMRFESDFPEVSLQGYSIDEDFTLAKIEGNEIVADVSLWLHVGVSVHISFSVTDGINGDDVSMGAAEVSRDVDIRDVRALVAFARDLQEEDCDIINVELAPISSSLDLGFVEPDWKIRELEEPD